jgi:hypothetical protein
VFCEVQITGSKHALCICAKVNVFYRFFFSLDNRPKRRIRWDGMDWIELAQDMDQLTR